MPSTGLDNDVALPAEDFILKPVKGERAARLARPAPVTQWVIRGAATGEPRRRPGREAGAGGVVPPAQAELEALAVLVDTGYVRGIQKRLDEIEARDPDSTDFVAMVRDLARGFQLDAISKAHRTRTR